MLQLELRLGYHFLHLKTKRKKMTKQCKFFLIQLLEVESYQATPDLVGHQLREVDLTVVIDEPELVQRSLSLVALSL